MQKSIKILYKALHTDILYISILVCIYTSVRAIISSDGANFSTPPHCCRQLCLF